MSEKDDLDWLDSLAGRDASASPEARELRAAILARANSAEPVVPAEDAGRETDLIARARREGLLVDASELAGNPFARRSSLRATFRNAGSRGWAAAALAIGVLALAWNLRPTDAPEELLRGSTDGVAHLQAADPRALKQQIVDELRAVGVQATGYEQLGVSGIDADLPQPLPEGARRVLEQHRIAVPKDGVLRVEIATPEGR
jgi:hypothetical protein